MARKRINREQGFSLLEAIVALAILGGATMVLFGWIGGSLNQLTRAELYIEADPVLSSTLEYLKFQDLSVRPVGELNSGDVIITWQSTPIEHDIPGTSGSNFLLSLYDVTLTIKKGNRTLPPLRTRIVNYRLISNVGEQDVF